MRTIALLTRATALAAAIGVAAMPARADVVTDWNARAADIATAAKTPAPQTYRTMAIVQAAVFEAVNAITHRYPAARGAESAAPGASVDAAVASATRAALAKLAPAQREATEAAYVEALKLIPEAPGKAAGIAAGERAAAQVLAARDGDGWNAPDGYRPQTAAGAYVPTVIPVLPHWGKRKPWFLASGSQFRPGPPPALTSETWARDYEEIRALGAKGSTRRTAEQTAVAKFWEATTPAIYFPLARSVTDAPGREVTENARLLATMAMAMDDALIAVFDAKYAHGFWRPVTAIRNGDRDGNDRTERDPDWLPLIDTPMHPEYPCAHCIIGAAAGAVLRAAAGTDALRPSTTSPTAPGVVRSWSRIDQVVEEVSMARICGGVHYRNSTEVGVAMGRKVGEVAVTAQRRVAEAR